MQIEIKIDSSYSEPKIIILTNQMTEEINGIMERLSENSGRIITGSKNGKIQILEPDDIYRIYACAGKVLAIADSGEYLLRLRLYEAEEILNPSQFVRISNSEIINLKKVSCFDLSFTGTIYVEFENGEKTYVSRRHVSKLKEKLGL